MKCYICRENARAVPPRQSIHYCADTCECAVCQSNSVAANAKRARYVEGGKGD